MSVSRWEYAFVAVISSASVHRKRGFASERALSQCRSLVWGVLTFVVISSALVYSERNFANERAMFRSRSLVGVRHSSW